MTDVHSPEARQRNMAAIRANNTRPELIAVESLHSLGYRFRLHVRDLPGRPDIVLPKHRAVILINGCFFHGHDCSYFKWPSTRADFWRRKSRLISMRDARKLLMLHRAGWRVLTIWECALRGAHGQRQEASKRLLEGRCRKTWRDRRSARGNVGKRGSTDSNETRLSRQLFLRRRRKRAQRGRGQLGA